MEQVVRNAMTIVKNAAIEIYALNVHQDFYYLKKHAYHAIHLVQHASELLIIAHHAMKILILHRTTNVTTAMKNV